MNLVKIELLNLLLGDHLNRDEKIKVIQEPLHKNESLLIYSILRKILLFSTPFRF